MERGRKSTGASPRDRARSWTANTRNSDLSGFEPQSPAADLSTMAEALGLATAVLSLLATAKQVYTFLQDVRGAGKEFAKLRVEVKSVEVILTALDELVRALQDEGKRGDGLDEKWVATIQTLNANPDEGPVAELKSLLQTIQSVVQSATVKNRLLWPLRKADVDGWLSVMERHKSTLVLALQNDQSRLSAAIYKSVLGANETLQRVHHRQVQQERREGDEEKQKILRWLSPTEHAVGHATAKTDRLSGSGRWLVQSPEFAAWLSGSKQTLYCPGIPGAGKTVIASAVIDHLKQVFVNDNDVGVAYIYYKYNRPGDQHPDDLALSLARQLIEVKRAVPADVKMLYDESREKGGNDRPSGAQATEMLRAAARKFSRVLFVLDALDECRLKEHRVELLDRVFTLESLVALHVMATSRIDPDIASYKHFSCDTTTEKPIIADPDDMLQYIQKVMMTGFEFKFRKGYKPHQDLQEQIGQKVLKSAAEV